LTGYFSKKGACKYDHIKNGSNFYIMPSSGEIEEVMYYAEKARKPIERI